jgi:hypothetical protein
MASETIASPRQQLPLWYAIQEYGVITARLVIVLVEQKQWSEAWIQRKR